MQREGTSHKRGEESEMKRIFVVVVLLAAVSAVAQSPAPAMDGSASSNVVFGGYTYARTDFSPIIGQHNGATVGYTRYLSSHFGVEAQGTAVFGNLGFNGADIMGGARVNLKTGRAVPYLHALVGYGKTKFNAGPYTYNQSDMTTKLGAGLDVFVTRKMGIRVIQFDWRRQMLSPHSSDWMEISTGIFTTW